MNLSLSYYTSLRGFVAVVWMIGMAAASFGQTTQIAHFVSPPYPPLARQAGIAGMVTLSVNVEKDGSVAGISENGQAHPLLSQEAKASITKWKFQPRDYASKLGVVFYYGFSGDMRDMNPNTTVKVDFETSSIRVFITTDTVRTTHP